MAKALKKPTKAAKPAKAAAKGAAKPVAKPVAKKAAAKTASKPAKSASIKAAAKAPVKSAAKSVVKPSKPAAKKPAKVTAPVKKSAPKAAAKPTRAAKAPAVKAAAKPAAKPAPKAPAKPVAKKAPVKPAAKPAVAKAPARPAAKPTPKAPAKAEVKAPTGREQLAARRARSAEALRAQVAPKAKKPTQSATNGKSAMSTTPETPAPAPGQPNGVYNGVLLCDTPKPFPTKSPYSDQEIQRLREALIGERARLISSLSSLQGVSREAMDLAREHPGYSVHMAEHATDLQTAEASMGVRSIENERLEQVESALERIDKSASYGLCLACGSKIGIQRLIARPHAHLCMECATRYEKIRSRRQF